MKINGINIGEIRRKYAQQNNRPDKTSKNNPKDSMSISNRARQISDIDKKLSEIPDIRQERVDNIRNAIQNGQYEIDSRAIARKIISNQD
ncbi:MAG: flagellar biosynthesis anti-sigma factor FlgM [Halanaerobiales bacterium]